MWFEKRKAGYPNHSELISSDTTVVLTHETMKKSIKKIAGGKIVFFLMLFFGNTIYAGYNSLSERTDSIKKLPKLNWNNKKNEYELQNKNCTNC